MTLKRYLLMLSLTLTTWSCAQSPIHRDVASPGTAFSSQLTLARRLAEDDRQRAKDPIHGTQVLHHGVQTKKAVLIMHGLHESPYYMKGLAEDYFSRGYNVISLRLPGHLTPNSKDLNEVKYQQWIEAAEKSFQALQGLGEDLEIAGYSTGGTLGVYLTLSHPGVVRKLVLIAPALALSNTVVLAGLSLGFTGLDASRICKQLEPKSRLCRALTLADDQVEPMLREGLNVSPWAGFQVQALIDHVLVQFGPARISPASDSAFEKGYYDRLMELYEKLSVPIVMVNTEMDGVVNWKFNQNFIEAYKGPKEIVLYAKSRGISHIAINKPSGHCFQKTPAVCNPEFGDILRAIQKIEH